MRKLVIATGMGFDVPIDEQIRRLAAIGWEGVFTGWDEQNGNSEIKKTIDAEGLVYQSIHAPFTNCHLLWEEGEQGDAEMNRQIRCLQEASDMCVPLVVAHTIIGFNRFTPTDLGVERFAKMLDEAEKLGVTLALENTEGECYLDRLMTDLHEKPALGFCIDTGHEMCYNESRDLITKYGDKLVCTHLNDNMKITGEKITWLDDSHMLPFDGLADWEGIAKRLKAAGYSGDWTFELTSKNKPERNTHDIYAGMSFDEFAKKAYEKAVRFAKMME